MGFPPDQEPSEAEYVAAKAWWAASSAAMEARCAGWSDEKRYHVDGLQLLHDPETAKAESSGMLSSFIAAPAKASATGFVSEETTKEHHS